MALKCLEGRGPEKESGEGESKRERERTQHCPIGLDRWIWNVRPVSEAEQGKFHHCGGRGRMKSRSPVSCAALTGLEMRTLLKGAWKNRWGRKEGRQWRIKFIARAISDSSSNHEWYFRLSSVPEEELGREERESCTTGCPMKSHEKDCDQGTMSVACVCVCGRGEQKQSSILPSQ